MKGYMKRDQLTETARSIANGKDGDVKAWALTMIHVAASLPYAHHEYHDEYYNLLWWNVAIMNTNPALFLDVQDVAIEFLGPGSVEPSRDGNDLDQLLDYFLLIPIAALTYDKEASREEAKRLAEEFLTRAFGERSKEETA